MHNTALVWFRRDLRLHDQAALYHALKESQQVICVFIFDSTILEGLPQEDRRVSFIWHSLLQLKKELIASGSDLVIRYGNPVDIIPELVIQHRAHAVYINHDIEPSAMARDAKVAYTLAKQNCAFYSFKDQVIFEKDEVLTQSGGMYQVFTAYKRAWLHKINDFYLQSYPVKRYLHHLAKLITQPIPELAELGFAAVDVEKLKPGCQGGSLLFKEFFDRIDLYREARDFPGIKGVSYLSVHLRFGTVSIRELARAARLKNNDGADCWLSELIWRDFYQQLLWHRPELVTHTFQVRYDKIPFSNNQSYFVAWCEGQTGFPIVDAAMRQLNQTGYMHNRLRMIVASFLVKDLLVDWRWGEHYFALKLNDFDLASNSGGWQWAASVGCDAQPYFRIFNPVTQSRRFDPQGAFIRRYCPELAHLNAKQIHAPYASQTKQNDQINLKLNYPHPIVDHAQQRKKALDLFGHLTPSDKIVI